MHLFAPHHLPGVGMGNLASLEGLLGLVGMSVTSGALVAEGAIGTVIFLASAIAVLSDKRHFGGAVPAEVAVFVVVALLVALRLVLERRARAATASLVGLATDAPETRAIRACATRGASRATMLTILAVAIAGAAAGFAWSEWNEVPFRLGDTESVVGLVVGLVAGAIGGDAAWRFLTGAVRAGASAPIVGVAICIVAYVLNAASVYVPFVGIVALVLAIALALRLRRRAQAKHAGLRILR